MLYGGVLFINNKVDINKSIDKLIMFILKNVIWVFNIMIIFFS